MPYRCERTGQQYQDFSDGIWDDDEWISWDWINEQIHHQDLRQEFPEAEPEVVECFQQLVDAAAEYKALTGRYLQIWGELGELFAEIKYGIQRHKPMVRGSDGRLGNDFIEIKTISPEKEKSKVEVKRAGNFNYLLIVKISDDFQFESKLIPRTALNKGNGKVARVSWENAETVAKK